MKGAKFAEILKKAGICMLASLFFISNTSFVYAATSWTQTDWSSGVGASTTNQYSSGSSIDATTTSGQVTLTNTEKFSNTGFESDLTGWTYAGAKIIPMMPCRP